MKNQHEVTALWQMLNDIPDPEVPAISIVELGSFVKLMHMVIRWKW